MKKSSGEAKAGSKKAEEITFTCKFCGQSKPLSEMKIITRFFPPMVACQDCARKVQ